MKNIKNYIWFIIESQSFMEGSQSKIKTFFQSLKRGIGFVKMCNVFECYANKYGYDETYAMMDRMVNFDKEI